MKTIVKTDTFDDLYITCIIEKNYLCSISLEMLQEAFNDTHLDAKVVRSKDVIEVIINLGSPSTDLDTLEFLSKAIVTIISTVHIFETAKIEYQRKLNVLKNDLRNTLEKILHEVSEPTTSPTEESSCKRQ